MKRFLLPFVFVALLFTACSVESPPERSPMIQSYDLSGEVMLIQVITYDNFEQIRRAKIKFVKEQTGKVVEVPELYGWAVWSKPSGQLHQCQIHVLKLKAIEDKQMHTWGHELAHCIYGSFHEE